MTPHLGAVRVALDGWQILALMLSGTALVVLVVWVGAWLELRPWRIGIRAARKRRAK